MSESAANDLPLVRPPRILVMGVGSSGARTVSGMKRLNPTLPVAVVDTDTRVLDALSVEQKIHVGASTTSGFSAGGDVELGRQAIEKDSSNIRRLLRHVDLLVLVAGFGGGTGSGAVPVIARIAREAGTLVLCMVGMPFAFEGKQIARIAEEALKRTRTHADAIIRIPNERLIDRSEADLPAEKAFSRSQQLMADALFALQRLLASKGVVDLDFACIQTMLRNCDGFCHLATADGSGPDRAGQVAQALTAHPLLNGGKLLGSAAGLVLGLTGGPDLRLSEIETVMERIHATLPEEVWMNFGVVLDPAFEGRLALLALVAEQWKEPLVDAAGRQTFFRYDRGQGELPLELVGKGEFAQVDPTIHNNQDLDVPTYIRRDIKLPR